MKHLFVAVFGLVLGIAAALATLYYNPLTGRHEAAATDGAERVFRYALPDKVLELEVGQDASLLGDNEAGGVLWEETVTRAAAFALELNDDTGQPTAIASRLLAPSADSDLLLRGLLVNEYTLLTVPGDGTLFVRAEANVWPFVKETAPAWYFGRPWRGPSDYSPTVGPDPLGDAVVVGLSGTFSGLASTASERYSLTTLDRDRRFAAARGELRVLMPGSRVAVQAE